MLYRTCVYLKYLLIEIMHLNYCYPTAAASANHNHSLVDFDFSIIDELADLLGGLVVDGAAD